MTSPDDHDSAPAAGVLTQRQIYTVMGGVMTGMAMAALDATIVNTALATIVGDLGGLKAYTWIGTAYLLTSTAATPLFGKLSDIFGRRRLFQVAIAAFMVGSVLCGLAQTMTQLVLARGVQGIGGGGLFALSFTIVGDIVPPRERGRYVGAITSVFTLASVVGPLLGGFFVDTLTWRWIFWINVPIGVAALLITNRALHLRWSHQAHRVDWSGAVLLVVSVTTLLLAVSWTGEEYGWTSSRTLALLAVALATGLGFVWWESRATEPIVPLSLFRVDVVRIIVPLVAITSAVLYSVNVFLPLFLQSITGVSATSSGLLLIPMAIGVAVSATMIGRATSATGRYKIWPIVGSLSTTAGLVLFSQLGDSTGWLYVAMAGMVLVGVGIGGLMPTSTLAVQNAVDWHELGVASSLVTFMRSLGGAIGLAAFGAVMNAEISGRVPPELLQRPRAIHDLPDEQRTLAMDVLLDGITKVFAVAVPLMLVGLVLSLFLPERPLRSTSGLERSHSEA